MTSDPQAPGQGGSGDTSRLGVHSIKEVSGRQDNELAVIFREMRRASGVTQEQIAGRLATSVATIEALEAGSLAELPDWTELKRIVTTYAAQLGLDSRPILRRMQGQLGVADDEVAAAAPSQPKAKVQPPSPPRPAVPPRPPMPTTPTGLPMPPSVRAKAQAAPAAVPPGVQEPVVPPAAPVPPKAPERPTRPAAKTPPPPPQAPLRGDTEFFEDPPEPVPPKKNRGRKLAKGALNWLLLILFVAALGSGIWYASQNPRQVWKALDRLPDPIPGLMRGAWEMVRPLDDSRSGSQASDPDKRRSDKLP